MIATLYFDDLAAIQRAFASEEGRAAAADRKVLAPTDSDFLMFLFESREI